MNLIIDAGNTRFKYAFCSPGKEMFTGVDREKMLEEIEEYTVKGTKLDIFLSGSGKIEEALREQLKRTANYWLDGEGEVIYPLQIDYQTPATLGVDRIAVCVGAWKLFPRTDLLVINSGTAITYNYVTQTGIFLGGNISPGQQIRFRSLHEFTARLPYIEGEMNFGEMGRTTEEAVQNGVMNGIVFEIQKYIELFYKNFPEGKVILTGGNSFFIKDKLIAGIAYEENLGFIGLSDILEYNKKDKETLN
ncbi:type III pantothenate kinase [uncultured Odoribacter sp.]|uniref:type III pantothenate kinase n=1 Tax=uncultured Odoribacter sp. TaxID=876416 RepID=UPI002634247D|nr:type III pantothenate kinase [uncultured Odoribacter sp.]